MNNSRSDYRICPYCGAALDVGEKCDCTQERQTAGQSRRTQGGFFAAKAIKPTHRPQRR